MGWKTEAKCHGLWDIFDGVENEDGTQSYPRLAEAQQICSTCPVFEQCKAAGMGATAGIWAGEGKGL